MATCSVCGVKLTFRGSLSCDGRDYCRSCLKELEAKEPARAGHPAGQKEMGRKTIAALLGLVGFFVFMFVAEAAFFRLGRTVLSVVVVMTVLAGYFFSCQFLLSRDRPDAWREDWPVVLSLVASPLALMSPALVLEGSEAVLVQGSIMLAGCSASYAGAVAASLSARRKRARGAANWQSGQR